MAETDHALLAELEGARVQLTELRETLEEVAALSPYPAAPESDPFVLGRDQGHEDAAELARSALNA